MKKLILFSMFLGFAAHGNIDCDGSYKDKYNVDIFYYVKIFSPVNNKSRFLIEVGDMKDYPNQYDFEQPAPQNGVGIWTLEENGKKLFDFAMKFPKAYLVENYPDAPRIEMVCTQTN